VNRAIIRAMSKITLKLRNLDNGDSLSQEFDDEAATIAFLKDRPAMRDVLGVVFEGLTPEQNARLRAAVRPLDPVELAAERKLDEEAEKKAEAAAKIRAAEEEKARAAHREAMKTADPNRPMEIRYRYDGGGGLGLVDPEDPREITAEAKAAVEAWVAERNEWVESRGQIVGEAKVTVWPGTLPKPNADRVQGGSFVPCAAPEKPKS
jgi:hypothetical protein